MRRLTEAWFEFAGVRSDEIGVRLLAMPKRPQAAEKGERLMIPGRSGYLWMSEAGAREAVELRIECVSDDAYNADAVAEWLSGEGLLVFSDEPNRAYQARVVDEFARESRFLHFDAQRFTVPFLCQPHRYLYPAAASIKLTAKGSVSNPGTAESLPRIKIAGSGNLTVNIGAYQVDVSGGTVIIDSEKMDCFASDGITLANSRVSMDEFPRLAPGANNISWSGNVSSVTIDGRWRYL